MPGDPIKIHPASSPARKLDRRRLWLDRLWLLLAAGLAVSLAVALAFHSSGELCAFLATDYRGYYASALIARSHGFASVYDQALQNAVQEALPLRCPGGELAYPRLYVSMPYLPVFVLPFLPLTALDFSFSYLLFSLLNLAVLAAYLLRFCRALGLRPGLLALLEWLLCLPLLSNLSLGQVNVYLAVCLGEFILAAWRGQRLRSGLWLAAMLVKPYVLFLLLAGLLVSRGWRALAGFGAGLLAVVGSSLLLAGVEGVAASLALAGRFAGPLIQTGPAMMNWRALALNLQTLLPAWSAWAIAGLGMAVCAIAALRLWAPGPPPDRDIILLRVLAALAATFAISWHAHFYLHLLLLPLLLALDAAVQPDQPRLPIGFLAAWAVGLPALYLAVALAGPEPARRLLGLGYLGLNLGLLAWACRPTRSTAPAAKPS